MIKTLLAVVAVLVSSLAMVQTSVASGGPGPSSGARAQVRLEARMRAGATEAKVSFRSETRGTAVRTTLEAEINRGAPNTTYPILLNGVQFATVTTNALGVGHAAFGRNIPNLAAGDTAGIGSMSGILRVR